MLVAASVWLLAAPFAASAQTDQGWPQFQGGPEHAGWAPSGPAPAYGSAWTLPVAPAGPDRQSGLSAPVISGDTIVAVAADRVLGVDVADGHEAWTVPRDEGPPIVPAIATIGGVTAVVYTEGFGEGPGGADPSASASAPADGSSSPSVSPTASPVAEGDTGTGGAEPFDSHLAAFDIKTREPLFEPVPLAAVSRTGVVVDGTTAFVGVNGGTVYAVDLTDGSVTWTVELGRPVGTPLTVADGFVLVGLQLKDVGTLPTVVALDAASGEERWRIDDDSAAGIVATAAAGQGTAFVIFSGRQESSVDAIDLATGERLWRSRFPRFFDPTASTPPVVTDEALFVADFGGQLFALDPQTGSTLWDFALNEGVFQAAPVAVAEHVIVGTLQGRLVALDAADGDLVWRSGGASDTAGPVRSIAVAGDRLVVVRAGPEAGLAAFDHDPEVTLIREASPTTFDPVAFVGGAAGAALIVGALTLVLGKVLVRRRGPAFTGDDPDPDDPDDDPEGDSSDDVAADPDAEDPEALDQGVTPA